MTRVHVVVEGPTEESFIKDVLSQTLWPRQVYLTPIILGPPGHKGGNTNYARLKKDLVVLLKQDLTAYCSTMLDLYGLGEGFPGSPVPVGLSNIEKAIHIEQAMKVDLIAEVEDRRPDARFLPYLQLHEYEGLLFSDPTAFAAAIGQRHLAQQFEIVRGEFATPEDINDDAMTAPSKRVLKAYPSYRKVLHGTLAARAVGIQRMRQECPHFREWLERLETLAVGE
jgi:hypothetical protein